MNSRVVIRENSEMIVDAFKDRRQDDDLRGRCVVLLEPKTNLKKRYRLLMAASLAVLEHNIAHKVWILNPFGEPQVVAPGS